MSAFRHIVTQQQPKRIGKPLPGKTGAVLAEYSGGLKAVVKFAREKTPQGKRKFYGITAQSGPAREVAFYELSKLLGWSDLVPETCTVTIGDEPASAQQFIPAMSLTDINKKLAKYIDDHERFVVHFRETMRDFPQADLVRLVVLDVIAGARDRHGNNLGARLDIVNGKPTYRLVGWDNAATFGQTFSRYHNVVHRYVFRFALDLEPYWKKLHDVRYDDFMMAVASVPTQTERDHAWLRLQFVLEYPHLLPFHVMSEGTDYPPEFPSYSSYFSDLCKPEVTPGTPGSLFILNRSRLSS